MKSKKSKEIEKLHQEKEELLEAVKYLKDLNKAYSEEHQCTLRCFTKLLNGDIFKDEFREQIDDIRNSNVDNLKWYKQRMEYANVRAEYYQKWLS
ncbi:hypothetical protein MKD35_241 [Aureococcus anophagefferens virus]|nr:hypothetical protein MKD35_241 [Aureococcus anophagefferens virus]